MPITRRGDDRRPDRPGAVEMSQPPECGSRTSREGSNFRPTGRSDGLVQIRRRSPQEMCQRLGLQGEHHAREARKGALGRECSPSHR